MSTSNYFSSSSRSRMGSNAYTDINQGGGNKKAGFPYQIGRDSWAYIAINTCNPKSFDPNSATPCCTLKSYQKLNFTGTVRQSFGVGQGLGGHIKHM